MWTLVITCSVGVVVAFQPRLHTNQVMFIYKEDDVFGPVNLPWWETQSLKHEMSPALNWNRGEGFGFVLTPEILGQAEKQSHCLVVLVIWAAGSAQHQGLRPWSSWGSKYAIHICAFYHLRGERRKYYKTRLRNIHKHIYKNFPFSQLTYLSLFSSGKGSMREKLWVNTSSPRSCMVFTSQSTGIPLWGKQWSH